MKKIVFCVTDEVAARILPLVIADIHEITVTYEGPDPVVEEHHETEEHYEQPSSGRKVFRGDKTAPDIILEMFDEDNPVRTRAAIDKHLQNVGFAQNTPSASISKLVAEGKVKRLGKDAVQIIPEHEWPRNSVQES